MVSVDHAYVLARKLQSPLFQYVCPVYVWQRVGRTLGPKSFFIFLLLCGSGWCDFSDTKLEGGFDGDVPSRATIFSIDPLSCDRCIRGRIWGFGGFWDVIPQRGTFIAFSTYSYQGQVLCHYLRAVGDRPRF